MTTCRYFGLALLGTVAIIVSSGCTRHEVEIKPVEIKPIHITIDVNVKIDKELDDFFGDIYDAQSKEAAKTNQ